METYFNYKGFGITYSSIFGRIVVDYCGFPLKVINNSTEEIGKEKAIKFVDFYLAVNFNKC